MSPRLAYTPIFIFSALYILQVGHRIQWFWIAIPVIYVAIGLKIAAREYADHDVNGAVWAWLWPLKVLKNGLFGHGKYQVILNEVPIAVIDKDCLVIKHREAIRNVPLYMRQFRNVMGAALYAAAFLMVICSSGLVFGVLYIGHENPQLLVDYVRAWIELGVFPHQKAIILMSKGVFISITLLMCRNEFAAWIGNEIRIHLKRPETGVVTIKSIYS